MQLISTVTIGAGGAASVSFNTIPQLYTDLLVTAFCRISGAVLRDGVLMRFNGDSTSANYTYNWLYTLNGSVGTPATGNIGGILAFEAPGASATSNSFGNSSAHIVNYTASTGKFVSANSVGGNNSTSATQFINAGRWNQTAAITSITILNASSNLVEGSTFSLYGILKGSGGATVA